MKAQMEGLHLLEFVLLESWMFPCHTEMDARKNMTLSRSL